jgi:hypothetical protein
MAYTRPGRGNPARKRLPEHRWERLRLLTPETWWDHENYYHHKAGLYVESDDVVIGCLWKRKYELAEHPLAVRRQVVGRMFGPKANTDYENPLDPEDPPLHHDTRGARRQDAFLPYKRVPLLMCDSARVRLRGRTDQRHGPQSDPEAGNNQNTSWVRGTLFKEGVRAVGTVTNEETPTTTTFSCDLPQISPCWENHRIRFVSGANKNFETYVEDHDRPTQEDTPILVMHDALPHAPSAGDRFVLMRDDRRSVKWRAGYRAAVEMHEMAHQATPIYGGKLYSSLYYGVRWSKDHPVEMVTGSSVPAPPNVGSHWTPRKCADLAAYPYSSQDHQWIIPDDYFAPLYRQTFWAADLAAGGPSDHLPGIWYEARYGCHLYGKGYDHPLGRDEETDEITSNGVLVGSVPDPITSGNMNWYLAFVHLYFWWPFYYRDETDPDPGTGQPRWTGVWPGETWFLRLVFVCIHTTHQGKRRIFGKYADEYSGHPVPLIGMTGMEWGASGFVDIQTVQMPHLTPAGYEEYDGNDENHDKANMVIPYAGPCSFAARGLLYLDRDHYDINHDEDTYYPCGVHLL